MDKPKILGMKSQEYPDGRIDTFRMSEENGGFEARVSCLMEIGFSEEDIRSDIDVALEDRSYLFLYLNEKLKVHLSAEGLDDFFIIRLDTKIPRKEIVEVIEKNFQIS